MGKKGKGSYHHARTESMILEKLGTLFALGHVKDPRVERVTLTGVKLSPDSAFATVYYFLGVELEPEERDGVRDALDEAAPFLRHQLGSTLRIKHMPVLRFKFDDSIEYGARIEDALRQIQAERDESDNSNEDA